MGDLDHTPIDINSAVWGHVSVTIASTIGQGNAGTSIPCKEAWIELRSGTGVRVMVGVAASATVGLNVPKFGTNHYVLRLPIADVSDLYFSGTNGDIVDILYRK